MTTNLSQQRVELPCPHCGHKFKESLGRLQLNPQLKCTDCGQSFNIDATKLKKTVKSVKDQLAKFKRDIGKMFR